MTNAPCKQCGSERIAPNVALASEGAASLLGRLRARVCADCGSVELRLDNAMELFLEYERSRGEASSTRPEEPSPQRPAAANIQCPSCGSVLPAAATTCEVCGWSQG